MDGEQGSQDDVALDAGNAPDLVLVERKLTIVGCGGCQEEDEQPPATIHAACHHAPPSTSMPTGHPTDVHPSFTSHVLSYSPLMSMASYTITLSCTKMAPVICQCIRQS